MLPAIGLAVLVFTTAETLLWLLVGPPLSLERFVILAACNLALGLLAAYLATSTRPLAVGAPGRVALKLVPDSFVMFRRGLNRETAGKAAAILAEVQGVRGVLVTDGEQILGAAGRFADVPELAGEVFRSLRAVRRWGRWQRQGRSRLRRLPLNGRPSPGEQAVAVSLTCGAQPAGFLVALVDLHDPQRGAVLNTVVAAAQLVSLQIELGQLNRQARLAAEAELRALTAQMNPHFLFNALHTIASYVREEPETARRLLVRLADLFRLGMSLSSPIIPFAQEYEYIKNYLAIEQARFRDRLKVEYDIDPQVLGVGIPALSIQPLVENAVRHGVLSKGAPGTVRIRARLDWVMTRLCVTVEDDGPGMPPEQVSHLLASGGEAERAKGEAHPDAGSRVALANIHARLKRLYGSRFSLELHSLPGRGTRVRLAIPMR